MKNLVFLFCCICFFLSACGNPGGIDDDFYEKYNKMGAPKFLYQCGDEIGYSAGVGLAATYNKLLEDAEIQCKPKKLKILKYQQ